MTRRCQLLRQTGGGWQDISAECGACPETLLSARNIGIFDFDGDGLLDIFVVEDRFTPKPRSTLFRNLGGLKFKDMTRETGLPENLFGLGLAVADINEDGRPDFFVGHANRLFLSQPGSRYREAVELGALFAHAPLDGEDWPCGVAFGDLNRDGRLDLVISAHSSRARNRVFLNDGLKEGLPRFREVTREAGLGDIIPAKCPHVEIQDFDNDGWPDIYFSAAWLEDGQITPLIYRNSGTAKGEARFEPPRPIREPMVYFPAGPSGDFDNDGRLDLFLVNWFAGNHSRLLHNETKPRHWLQVRVLGRNMNRMGLGAQVRAYRAGNAGRPESLLCFQEISTGYGYASGQPAIAHFGLDATAVVDVQVRFPSGSTVNRPNLPCNQLLTIEEQ